MNKKILVTYATRYGSTEEIARRIGETLNQAQLEIEVLPAEEASSAQEYQAVILGSSLYIGNWQKEAMTFLKQNLENLGSIPVWIFSSGPTGEGDPAAMVEGQRFLKDLQPIFDQIQPRDVVVFPGFIDSEKVSAMEKWMVKNVVKKPVGDFRDWNTIEQWAASIADELK